MKNRRSCIYPKDVQRITGKSQKTAQRILSQLKIKLGKQPHQYISVSEFAQYSGLDEELLWSYMDS